MARRSTSTLLSVALLLSFFVMNTVFNVFNKWLFSGPIRAPLFITATHQLACFMLAASTACVAPWAYSRTPLKSAAMVRKLAIIPFGFCVNIGLNNISLLYVTLALNQLVRSFAPVCVAIASYIFEDKVYSARYYATLVALTAGIAMGVSASPDFHFLGFLICISSVIGCTMQMVITGFFVGDQVVRLHVFDILLYTAIPSMGILICVSIAMGEMSVVKASAASLGDETFVMLVAFGSLMACAYNVLMIVFIKFTSSVYVAVAGGFKVALVIGVSFLVFDQSISTLSLAGILIACAAFVVNSHLQLNSKASSTTHSKLTDSRKVQSKSIVVNVLSDDEDGDDGSGNLISRDHTRTHSPLSPVEQKEPKHSLDEDSTDMTPLLKYFRRESTATHVPGAILPSEETDEDI